MYDIDFMTCTADDVILRSAVCHPSTFAEALRNVATVHTAAAAVMPHDETARNTALRMSGDCCNVAAYAMEMHSDHFIERLSFSERIQAFSAAARLQCLSPSLAHDIIGR